MSVSGTIAKIDTRLDYTSFILLFSGAIAASGQTALPSVPASNDSATTNTKGSIRLDVIAETKSGLPVTDLDQKDFTVMDNKSARPITSFKMVSAAAEPPRVILLIDAVNTPFSTVAYERGGVDKFLRSNEGKLASPTSIAVLTDDGVQLDDKFTTSGLALSDELQHRDIGLREITRSSEWGGLERLQICLNSLQHLITFAGPMPGRKIVIWISPGWPIISGPRIMLSTRQEQQIFDEIVYLSTQLRESKITLYNPNPVGVMESMIRANYYEDFLKGVTKPNQVQYGNLAIQVLAAQSGGLVIEGNSDVTGMIQRCVMDAKSWYAIGFDPLPADKPDEYHHIEIKIDRPGVVARTRDGYYANPVAAVQR